MITTLPPAAHKTPLQLPRFVLPVTPDEARGEADYFSRPVPLEGIVVDPALLSPPTLERIAPAAQRRASVDVPVAVPRIWGRRIPLPVRITKGLAVLTVLAFTAALSTLAIAVSNRIDRQRANHPA